MEMLCKCKEAFSLRDEIGTCPNLEVEINVTDRSPFFIRPYHVKEEDKALMDKEMKHLCYLCILKDGFSAYSSKVMLIHRKLTQDKRVVTDFRHLNVRMAKIFGLSITQRHILSFGKLQVCSVICIRFKGCISLREVSEHSKKYCRILPYFGSASYLYQRMPMD